jgi:hypothetical protein
MTTTTKERQQEKKKTQITEHYNKYTSRPTTQDYTTSKKDGASQTQNTKRGAQKRHYKKGRQKKRKMAEQNDKITTTLNPEDKEIIRKMTERHRILFNTMMENTNLEKSKRDKIKEADIAIRAAMADIILTNSAKNKATKTLTNKQKQEVSPKQEPDTTTTTNEPKTEEQKETSEDTNTRPEEIKMMISHNTIKQTLIQGTREAMKTTKDSHTIEECICPTIYSVTART